MTEWKEYYEILFPEDRPEYEINYRGWIDQLDEIKPIMVEEMKETIREMKKLPGNISNEVLETFPMN